MVSSARAEDFPIELFQVFIIGGIKLIPNQDKKSHANEQVQVQRRYQKELTLYQRQIKKNQKSKIIAKVV